MKGQLHNKLRSRTGASITYALLLFLTCTVVGTIVLASGSAAAGRVGEMAEMDQRYYSVSSAADLLGQELSGQKVTIERKKTDVQTVTTEYTVMINAQGSSVTAGTPGKTNTTTYTTKVNGSAPATETVGGKEQIKTSDMSFLTARAVKLMFGENSCNTETAWTCSLANGQSESGTFSLKCEGKEHLNVQGEYTLKSDGTLVFLIKSRGTTDNYTLRLTLSPSILESESSSSTTVNGAPAYAADGKSYTETVTTTTETTRTAEITWTVSSVEKIVSAPTSGTGGGSSGG